MATENIPSRLHSVAQGNVVTGANEILDDDKNKKQNVINQETDSALGNQDQRIQTLETAVGTGGSVDSRIATAKTEIEGGASSACNTLGKAEGLISTNASDIADLQEAYAALTQNDVVVVAPSDTWPVATPEQNIIYRVVDRVNTPPQYYSDYMWNGTVMVEMAQYDNAIDDIPTPASNNLVKSGGVASHIVYDISEANAVGSTLATYADLAAALGNNGANIPSSIQKGGMSVKFVQSSDNKYVQYRLMSNSFNTTPANWQGVDNEPTAGSDNLVKSGGVIFYPTLNNIYNRILNEIYIDGSLEDATIQIYKNGTYWGVEITIGEYGYFVNLYNKNANDIYKLTPSNGGTHNVYVYYVDSDALNNYPINVSVYVKLSKCCYNKSYSPTISEYIETKDSMFFDSWIFNKNVIKEIYTEYQGDVYVRLMYYQGYRELQFFSQKTTDISYLIDGIVNPASNTYIKTQNGLFEVVTGDLPNLTKSTLNCSLTNNARNLDLSPAISARHKEGFIISKSPLTANIKELFINTNETTLYARFYYWSGYKSFQICGDTQFRAGTLLAEFPMTKAGFIEDTNHGNGYMYIDSIPEYSQTSAVFELNSGVNDIFNSPILFDYFGRKIMVSKTGGYKYNSLTKALIDAVKLDDVKVIVRDGEYDLIEELKEVYGNDFWDNYTYQSSAHEGEHAGGIVLKNNVHVIFDAQAVVTCNYVGDNTDVMTYFSPFIGWDKGFTLENLVLRASRVRYAIHDENGALSLPYQNNYINCNLYIDNTNNTAWESCQTIGGGFGKTGIINIDGCIFESVGQNPGGVSYHNSSFEDGQCTINIRDCYFKGDDTFAMLYYGTSPKISTAYICGCSMQTEPLIAPTTPQSEVVNVAIVKWNNEIRQS